jgi:hypothetical protein
LESWRRLHAEFHSGQRDRYVRWRTEWLNKNVERVAVVTDSHFAGVAESLGKHFTSAEVKHFPFSDDVKALDWLKTA